MKRLVGLSIGAFQSKFGDKQALEIAKKIGADAVDFDLGASRFEPNIEGSLYSKKDKAVTEYFEDIKRYADELGMVISQTHGRCRSYINDQEYDKVTLEKTRLDCIATAALGAPVLVVHNITTYRMGEDTPAEFMHEFSYNMWMDMLPFAKQNGIKIATETFGDSSETVCDFFGEQTNFLQNYRRVKQSEYGQYFTACADTGHSNKAMRFGNPTPADVIRQIGSEITILHLNDNDTLTDQHKVPLSGTIDWQDVMNALDEIGYSGVYNMELSLAHFGKDIMVDYAEFSIKVMKNILKERYGE